MLKVNLIKCSKNFLVFRGFPKVIEVSWAFEGKWQGS